MLVPWPAPTAFSSLDMEKVKYVLDEIVVGVRDDDGKPTGDPYAPTKKGQSRWVGILMQEQLQLTEREVKEIIAVWLETGLLVEFKAKTKSAKGQGVRECLRVDNAKRPGAITDQTFL